MKNRNYTYIVCRDRETGELTGTVVAISHYAGKSVQGIAKCNPKDNFDIKFGKALAAARCNLKIAKKRLQRATGKYSESANAYTEAKRQVEKMRNYFCDATDAYDQAAEELRDIIAKSGE